MRQPFCFISEENMTEISKPNKLISQLLGQQGFNSEIPYRAFKYIAKYKKDGVNIAYNFLTRELVELTDEEYSLLEGADSTADIKPLVEKRFLVPESNDDALLCEQVRTFLKAVKTAKGVTSYTILPTTDCNARCFYCFETGVNKYTMDKITAVDTAEYIKKNSAGEQVEIRWFGGEPLYNVDVIDIISEKLKETGVSFKSHMVSNGYLFDDDIVVRAKNSWNLYNVQITLDGTEKIYNRCKNYIYKDVNAFESVIENIERLINAEICVSVRLNMDVHNSGDLYKLTDFLAARFGGNEYFSVYVSLLFENSGKLKIDYSDKPHLRLIDEFIEFQSYIEKQGILLKSKLPSEPVYTSCMADSDASVLILPTGELSRCEHALYSDVIGSIYSDELNAESIRSWKEVKYPSDECKSCYLYPECRPLKRCETQRSCNNADRAALGKKRENGIWRLYNKKRGKR